MVRLRFAITLPVKFGLNHPPTPTPAPTQGPELPRRALSNHPEQERLSKQGGFLWLRATMMLGAAAMLIGIRAACARTIACSIATAAARPGPAAEAGWAAARGPHRVVPWGGGGVRFYAIKTHKPTSPGRRHRVVNTGPSDLHRGKPFRALTEGLRKTGGRNNRGRITVRHRGGGHKRKYRLVDFQRRTVGASGLVRRIEYDPNRTANIALVDYGRDVKHANVRKGHSYIIAPEGLQVGDRVEAAPKSPPRKVGGRIDEADLPPIRPGNALELQYIPVGTDIHNVELRPGGGAQIARSAGVAARIVGRGDGSDTEASAGDAGEDPSASGAPEDADASTAPSASAPPSSSSLSSSLREGEEAPKSGKWAKYVIVRLPSGEQRYILGTCRATVGLVGNADHHNIKLGKAGASRWRGRRPSVRGVAMNPVDHPMGGGEGKASGGRPSVSPWGWYTKGIRTRNKKKQSNKYIQQSRRQAKRDKA